MSGQGNIKMINATELVLDYQATVIPSGGNDYPLKVNGMWEERYCPYSGGVGIVTDIRHPWIRQASGVPVQVGDGVNPYFTDTDILMGYLTKHPTTPSETIIVWSTTGRMVDSDRGFDVMSGDPHYLLCAGLQLIGGKFVYSNAVQNLCSWQHSEFFDWAQEFGTGLPALGTNWQEPDPAARVGVFVFDNRSALFRFKGGFQGTAVGQSIYAAIRFNPPTWSSGQVVSPSGTEYDALPIIGNGQAFNLSLNVGMKGHSAGLKVATVVAYCTAAGGRMNKGQTGVFGQY